MLRSTARITARVLSLSLVAVAAPVLAVMTAETASAHGNVSDPPARNFRCYQTWYGNHQDPSMPTVDPMCDYAWDNQPGAMYNWNGLFKENVAGNHQAALPDGTICGGNNSGYTTMNRVGPWIPTKKPTTFTLNLRDDSQHGADYLKIYISRQGYDPKTQPLKWSDLQLVKTTPRFAPANNYQTEVSVPGMTGHHVLFTIWQASHLDQSYYLCSDVDFGGGTSTPTEPTPTPTPTPTATATPTPTPTPTPTATATPTPTPTTSTPASAGCSATYRPVNQWAGGFQADVIVKAGSSAIRSWTVTWTWPNGQRLTNHWNASATQSGSQVTARNLSWNGSLVAGGSTTFGVQGSWSGSNGTPTLSCSAA